FSPVSDAARSGFFAYALPRPPRYLPDSSGSPILSQIAVQVRANKELWDVRVSLGTGEFYDAGARQLGAFTLRTNERANLTETTQFGLGFFSVRVVKILGKAAREPRITFKTSSISVEKLEVGTLPEPYHVVLRNNSDKEVLAIQYNTYKDQQMVQLKWLSSSPPLSLIKGGATYPLQVLSEDRTCADTDGYHPGQSNRIEIASVVFVDGSYEGDSGLAALVKGQVIGNKKNLDRVLLLLNTFDGSEEPELLAANFRSLSEGMDDVAEPYLLDMLLSVLPPQSKDAGPGLTNLIRAGQHSVKRSLLSDAQQLDELIKTQDPAAIRNFVLLRSQSTLSGRRGPTQPPRTNGIKSNDWPPASAHRRPR
ncbi:MAG TPA: hypothetical protein VLQ90_04450, partial [Pyrinomonadaceae bacterium]|nr:hypothetical protein [Pyrinomonadaceae bacterium]